MASQVLPHDVCQIYFFLINIHSNPWDNHLSTLFPSAKDSSLSSFFRCWKFWCVQFPLWQLVKTNIFVTTFYALLTFLCILCYFANSWVKITTLQVTDCSYTSNFEHICSDITNTSCLSTLNLATASLTPRKGGGFINGWINIHRLLFSGYELLSWRICCVQLLKMLNPLSPLSIHVWRKSSVCCLYSVYLKGKFEVELLQVLVITSEVIFIEMTLEVLSEMSDMPLLVLGMHSRTKDPTVKLIEPTFYTGSFLQFATAPFFFLDFLDWMKMNLSS